ncbi:MAG: hypothetical protein HY904_23995 [Deltaproteobacteria bacterium]|nr:hypothetical protein [Deltaproteobacteria bacterium]
MTRPAAPRAVGGALTVITCVVALAACPRSPCGADQVERDGQCLTACNSSQDCPASHACVDGVCAARASSSSSGGVVSSSTSATPDSSSADTVTSAASPSSASSAGSTGAATTGGTPSASAGSSVGGNSSAPGATSVAAAGSSTATAASSSAPSSSTAGPDALRLLAPPGTPLTVGCVGPIGLEVLGPGGTPLAPAADLVVGLGASSPQAKWYLASACAGADVSSVTVPARSTALSLYLFQPVAGSASLTATAPPLATGTLTLDFVAGPVTAVEVTPLSPTTTVWDCTELVVTPRDAFGNLVGKTRTPPVQVTGSLGVRVSTAAGCSNPSASVTVTPAAASGTASVHALSRQAGTWPVMATSEGTTLSASVVVVPPVRHGECALTSTSVTCPVVPPLVRADRTVLVTQVSSDGLAPNDGMVLCRLVDTGAISCERTVSGPARTLTWHTLELARMSTVQRVDLQCSGSSGTVTAPLARAVNPSNAFLLLSSTGAGTTYNSDNFATVTLQDGGTVRVDAPGCGGRRHHVQVVELTGATVDRAELLLPAGEVRAELFFSNVASSSFLLASWRYTSQAPTASPPCSVMIEPNLPSASHDRARVDRGRGDTLGCADVELMTSLQRVRLPSPLVIDTTSVDFSITQLQQNKGLVGSLAPGLVLPFASAQALGHTSGGQVRQGGNTVACANAEIRVVADVELRRTQAGQQAGITLVQVGLTPPP